MPAKEIFFRPKDFFFTYKISKNTFSQTFYCSSSFFFFNFTAVQLLSNIFFLTDRIFSNSFQGFFKSIFFTPSFAILHLKGIGYKCYYSKLINQLVFNTGFNHYSIFRMPNGLDVRLRKVFFIFFSNFFKVTKFVNIVRKIRFPDPYRAKGFRHKNQKIIFKVGKQR